MAYRLRNRGQFTAPESRSGGSYVFAGRSVRIEEEGVAFQLNWRGPEVVAELLNAMDTAMRDLGDQALAYMRSITPVDTGRLRDSEYLDISVEGSRIVLRIGATAPYAVYVELGTA